MTFTEAIKHIRETPRRMREDYVKSLGVFDELRATILSIPEISNWKFKEQLDYLIADRPNLRCYCGGLLKIGANYCSAQCTGRSEKTRAAMSIGQKANAASRMEKSKATMLKRYGVTHNNHIESCVESRKKKRAEWVERTNRETFERVGLNIDDFNSVEKLQPLIDSCVSLEELRTTHFGSMSIMTMCRHIWK